MTVITTDWGNPHEELIEGMIPSHAKLYFSASTLYELSEKLGVTERHRRQSE